MSSVRELESEKINQNEEEEQMVTQLQELLKKYKDNKYNETLNSNSQEIISNNHPQNLFCQAVLVIYYEFNF